MTATTPQKSIWYKNPILMIFVIGLPVTVLIVCIFFIVFAVKIQDSTVRDDWYMDGKALYQDASKDKLAYDLNISGIMRFDGDQVVFELTYPDEILKSQTLDFYPKTLNANISHATDKKKDRDFVLTHIDANRYQGEVALDPTPAKYYLQVNNGDGNNAWRLIQPYKLPANNVPFFALKAFDEPSQ